MGDEAATHLNYLAANSGFRYSIFDEFHHLLVGRTKYLQVHGEGRRIAFCFHGESNFGQYLGLRNNELENINIHIGRYFYAVYNCSYFRMRLDYIFTPKRGHDFSRRFVPTLSLVVEPTIFQLLGC